MRMSRLPWTMALVAAVVISCSMIGCGGSHADAAGPALKTTNLFAAIDEREIPVIIDELHKGADVNAKDPGGQTPLHHAVTANDRKIIEVLLEAGADTSITNAEGKTPLEVAQGEHLATAISALK